MPAPPAPEAQLPQRSRRARNLAIAIGLAGFAYISLAGGDSATLVAVMGSTIVVAAVTFFTLHIRAQNRSWRQQEKLLAALALEKSGPTTFTGEVDGTPVTIDFELASGRSWDDRTDRYRTWTYIAATRLVVGEGRRAPPSEWGELGVREERGRWHWKGEQNCLDDPAAEAFIRRLAAG